MLGTTQLPIELLQAAHKRLFGAVTRVPASWDVRTIGFALFHWQTLDYEYRNGKTWRQYCLIANGTKREQVKAAVADLLTELEG